MRIALARSNCQDRLLPQFRRPPSGVRHGWT